MKQMIAYFITVLLHMMYVSIVNTLNIIYVIDDVWNTG